MERIKQALELARIARQKAGGSATPALSPTPTSLHGGVTSPAPITYTQTKTVDVAEVLMRENRIVDGLETNIFSDAYKILRTQVLQRMRAQDKACNALAITSPSADSGKTLTAINLGISLAMEVDSTVLLVDADLRNPHMHEYFGLTPKIGLSDYLADDGGKIALADMLIHVTKFPHFIILPGGKPVANSSEMLSSPKMARLVEELKERYPSRFVLFDLPPLLSAADAMAFTPYVDAALLVVEEGKTPAEEVSQAYGLLQSTHVLGTVLNKVQVTVTKQDQPGFLDKIKKLKWINRILNKGS